MDRLAHLVLTRARFVLLAAVALVAVSAAWGLGVFGHLDQGGFDDQATDSARELAQERALFGNRDVDVVAIYRSARHQVDDPAFRREVEQTLAGIPAGTTTHVTTWWQTHDPSLVSSDRHATQVLVSLAGDDQAALSDNDDRVVPALRASDLQTQIAGQWAVYRDVNTTVSADLARAESVSLPVVLVLSLLIFGSVVAALMPVMVGAIAVVGALAVVRLLTTVTDVSVFSINVITLLGMGLAIDYALFVISRFREELARGQAPAGAISATMRTAGRTVLFSALTVAGALASLLIFPQDFLRSLGYGGIAAVLVAAVAALTVLPAVLFLLGPRIDAGRLPWRRGRAVPVESDHGAWARVAHAVMRRPVVVMVVLVAGLLLLASPFLGVKWGSVDYRVLPPDSPSHVAATTLAGDFGGETSTASILLESGDRGAVASYAARAADVPGVLAVQPVARDADATLLRAVWHGNSQTQASQDLVKELRAIPGPGGEHVLVGGASAQTVDLLGSIGRHLPWMALTIAAVMLVLLFLAFGSLVLPVKAIAMNLLSIGASFGVITWIFADGHLEGLLDYRSNGFLDATQPIFMLAVLVGLSMDYEVFLLSRVREQWDATGDNTLAVATGVQKTGRIITSAALLLAVVIGAFSLSGITFMKLIGIGMLVALLVDATVVRALLVPATMRLLGRWNWWAPAPLRRLWERYGVREGEVPPATEPAPEPVDAMA
ncbi:MAG TPA: MMPL family transporter [Marmoricola sp.]|nr:MMPL family transporter [Marmoricola sp.]